jgi:hypothetical protein
MTEPNAPGKIIFLGACLIAPEMRDTTRGELSKRELPITNAKCIDLKMVLGELYLWRC